jgi:alpha-galactosidase
LTIGGATYATGIGAHADSAVHVHLGRACSVFSAKVGVDDEVGDRGSVRFQVYGDGKLLAYSNPIGGAQGSTALNVAIGGYRTLELRVTDGRDTVDYDHADWGEARITCSASATGPATAVSERTWTSSTNGWGPAERDQSNGELAAGDGVVPNVAGVNYVRAIGVHAAGTVTVPLGGSCRRLTAVVGVDAETAGQGSVAFAVVADGTTIATTPTLLPAQAAVIDVDVTGRHSLQLTTSTGGDDGTFDHADWADARLVC